VKQEIINYLKNTAGGHLVILALVVLAFIGGSSWLQEHDARIKAEITVKAAQEQINTLQAKKGDADKAAKTQIVILQKEAAAVKTPRQAIDALPSVTNAPLAPVPVTDLPDDVAVNAVALYKNLNECKQDAVNLAACSAKLDIQEQIDGKKDEQITALRKKPGFWKAVKSKAITLGIGAITGYVLAHR
jgi:hypothetical protein